MQSTTESVIKLVAVSLLLLAGLAVWLLPKTRLVKQRHIGERAFVAHQIIGMVCGACGLVVLFAWPQRALELHLWESAVMPYALVYFYWLVVMRRARTTDVTDEKQSSNMAAAAGIALGPLTVAMLVAFLLQENGLFLPSLWYPYFLLVMVLCLSTCTLVVFRRA